MRPLTLILLVLSTVALCACDAAAPAAPAAPTGARIVRVIDGDTIVASVAGQQEHVRLLGIDTPEKYGGPVECGARAASARMKQLAAPGTAVRLVIDPESGDTRDRYGRLLAYVDTKRGDLGLLEVKAGLAYVYRYNGRRFSRLDRYNHAQAQAHDAQRATWSRCQGDFHSNRPGRQP